MNHADPDGIPRFLCRVCSPVSNARAVSWPGAAETVETDFIDPIQERQEQLLEAQDAKRKAKREEALARHLNKHMFEKWDAKAGLWVRDEDKINAHHAALEADGGS
jgi:hypothetical protein